MKKLVIIIAIVTGVSNFIFGQRLPESNQYMINRFALSPSYAGLTDYFGAFVGFRKQWTDIQGSPTSKYIYLNAPFLDKKIGLGGTIISDETDIFTHFYGALSYAYHLKLAENHMLGFGLSGVIFQNSIDLTKIKVENINDPIIQNKQTITETVFNAGASLLYVWKGLNVGISVPIIIDNKSLYNKENKIDEYMLTRHYLAHASYDLKVKENWQVEPYVIARMTEYSPVNVEIATLVRYKNQYWLGAAYHTEGGIGISGGLKIAQQVMMNYTYEFAGSGILGKSSGTHEIGLGVYFGKQIKKLAEDQLTINKKADSITTATNEIKKQITQVNKDNQDNKNDHQGYNNSLEILQQRLNDAELEIGNLKNKYSGLELQQKTNEVDKKIKDIETDLNEMGGQFFVIVESFKFKENAEKAVGLWKTKGVDVIMSFNEARQWYYVYAGKYATYAEAVQMKNKLAEKNVQSWVYLWIEKK